MITKSALKELIASAVKSAGFNVDQNLLEKATVDYPEAQFGDFTSNVAMVLAKDLKLSPRELAEKIIACVMPGHFEKIEIAGPGFINFFMKNDFLLAETETLSENGLIVPEKKEDKILVEYFQPNIAKPMHVGLLQNAVIGDAIARMLKYQGYSVESDTHMGDWGTQFGILLLAYKKYGNIEEITKDPITKLNELYVRMNTEIESNPELREQGKQEFVKLELGDLENRKIWQQFVDWSLEKFLKINEMLDILPFDNHWPESFFTDKMPAVLDQLKAKGLLVDSRGAQIVDLEEKNLGVAIVVKSDGGTIYLLRDLATFLYRKSLGFKKQLYVIDNRQSHAFKQLFEILKMTGDLQEGEGVHIDYGFTSFKGAALSTRKGNMVLVDDLIKQTEEKVSAIIEQKNPDLKNKELVTKAVTKGALKYFYLSHNRHSDVEFDWANVLDFEGNSGPYLQYAYARLSSILRKEASNGKLDEVEMTSTERQIIVELSKFNDVLEDSLKDFLPNIFANYLYNLAALINKFYHESPVIKETDAKKKQFRLQLITATRNVYGKGLDLLGIVPLEEM